METRLLRAPADLDEAAAILRAGGLVAFPTETVYGLGALGLDSEAVERVFAAKERPHSDPLILHLGEPGWVSDLTPAPVPSPAEALMARFWPGPLTLVLPRSRRVPDVVTAGGPTVAVRMPAHPMALELIRRVGAPVAAPSANLFSRPSPTRAEDVLEDLSGRIDAVLDGGPTPIGVESTVLDLSGREPVLLRPGGVTREALEAALGGPVVDRRAAGTSRPLPSPGLLERHYSPRAEVALFDGPRPQVLEAMRSVAQSPGSRLLAWEEDLPLLEGVPEVVNLGRSGDPATIAARLYRAFREADRDGVRRLVVSTLPGGGLAEAVNDRLRRAASGVVRRVE